MCIYIYKSLTLQCCRTGFAGLSRRGPGGSPARRGQDVLLALPVRAQSTQLVVLRLVIENPARLYRPKSTKPWESWYCYIYICTYAVMQDFVSPTAGCSVAYILVLPFWLLGCYHITIEAKKYILFSQGFLNSLGCVGLPYMRNFSYDVG